ncbi:hypothetical protein SSX86_013252 [Deinandra increscens subsp. villosa]|uniref:Uncharacterized protein n=1 Tax=Deinandra increscens subsp. villosa TaxID=3103831 RepID=A0AAP0H1E7_9ASTR
MEGGYEYDGELKMKPAEEGCATPRHDGCRIPPVPAVCPPPPKKKRWSAYCSGGRGREPPKNGYFRSPEIEIFFARHKACAN